MPCCLIQVLGHPHAFLRLQIGGSHMVWTLSSVGFRGGWFLIRPPGPAQRHPEVRVAAFLLPGAEPEDRGELGGPRLRLDVAHSDVHRGLHVGSIIGRRLRTCGPAAVRRSLERQRRSCFGRHEHRSKRSRRRQHERAVASKRAANAALEREVLDMLVLLSAEPTLELACDFGLRGRVRDGEDDRDEEDRDVEQKDHPRQDQLVGSLLAGLPRTSHPMHQ
eukprot:427706-Rhodomonas_salina.4